ncbi:MAG: hypothetical protein V4547_08945 [Bacteroidota bacterium]
MIEDSYDSFEIKRKPYTKHEPQPKFMTKVACEDEITMEDIRSVQNYRDQLCVVLDKRSPKPPEMKASEYTFQNMLLVNEIQGIHKWLKEKLQYSNEMA